MKSDGLIQAAWLPTRARRPGANGFPPDFFPQRLNEEKS
jgi:hypothetical protein